MEVILRNVPRSLSGDNLKSELVPFMIKLGIKLWHCEKPPKKNQAWLTFYNSEDGQRFLQRHEKITDKPGAAPTSIVGAETKKAKKIQLRDISRLHILRTPIYASKSPRKIDVAAVRTVMLNESNKTAPPKTSEKRRFKRDSGHNAYQLCKVACGKLMFRESSSDLFFAQQTETRHLELVHFRQRFIVVESYNENKIFIEMRTIQDYIIDPSDQSLTFVLTEPPRFYNYSEHDRNHCRSQTFFDWADIELYSGHCLVYRTWFQPERFDNIISTLRRKDLFSMTRQTVDVELHPRPFLEDYSTCMQAFEHKIAEVGKSTCPVPFSILFQVQGLVWGNYLHPRAGLDALGILDETAKQCRRKHAEFPITTDAMKTLFQSIPYPSPGLDASELDVYELLNSASQTESSRIEGDPSRRGIHGRQIARQYTWVLKALVTPTRIVLSGPDPENKNRVLRLFPQNSDYFLRVTFADEGGQSLGVNPRIIKDPVYDRYRSVLMHGITIAGRKFSFLGFAHSSLRAHSAWFSAPFVDHDLQKQTCGSILKLLGNFDGIRIPAKCAARIGQAFSETPYTVPLNNISVQYINDVKNKDGSRVFSDGVGTISMKALQTVWSHLPKGLGQPTCLQIRLAGIKGMLSLDTRLGGSMIRIRKESMMKFPSRDFQELGICDVASRPLRLMLNAQIIKILEDMGTKEEWFFKLQQKAILNLQGVTATAANTSTFLGYQSIGAAVGLPRLIRQLDRIGIDYRSNRFLKAVVDHVVLRELRLLKYKARMHVSKGVTLFGVMDEFGFLEEREVYVTFDARSSLNPHGIEDSLTDGHVLVTRSPALHPGDIQVANMRTPPDGHPLRNLKNCIVFSQKGERDLPSQLSGGDLDGDIFNIIWDKDAMPENYFEPAEYFPGEPMLLNRKVSQDDIVNFFVNFMKNDVVGMISMRHLYHADFAAKGTLAQECLDLASLGSTAVDYSKTGIPVLSDKIPKPPPTRPDFVAPAPPAQLYDLGRVIHLADSDAEDDDDEGQDGMGRHRLRYHKSEKILGKLFRAIDEKSIWNEHYNQANGNGCSRTFAEQVVGYVQSQISVYGMTGRIRPSRKIHRARKVRDLYRANIIDNMWRFSENPRVPLSEVETFCGSIFNPTGVQNGRQRDSSISLKEEMDKGLRWTMRLLNDQDGDGVEEEEVGPERDPDSYVDGLEDSIELCWACLYDVIAKRNADTIEETEYIESFDVIAASCLLAALDKLTTWLSSNYDSV